MNCDVLIVGAGLAGLMAANRLHAAGRDVLLLDKGRGVGGRLATRCIGPGRADHGAQFFTVREPEFAAFVTEWKAQELVYVWSEGWSDGLAAAADDGHARYAVRGGMAALAKQLARPLAVRMGVKVVRITAVSSGWQVRDETGQTYRSQALILTPPAPQSLALLAAGGVELETADRTALEAITYAPCLCGLFWVEGTVNVPHPGAVQGDETTTLSWLADNQRKGISPEAQLLTLHAGIDFSQRHYDDLVEVVLSLLQQELTPYLAANATIREAQLKRWRYARPLTLYTERYLRAAVLPPLLFAGDAFNGPRVEGAALSGLAAADALADLPEQFWTRR
jgi:renalase